jgi:putative RecB family exonuclease
MNYSHSMISLFENCKLAYKFRYIDKVKVDVPTTIEMFMGNMVHNTLAKLYNEKLAKNDLTKEELTNYYVKMWDKSYNNKIQITKKDLTINDYKNLGVNYLETYYDTYFPFKENILGVETNHYLKLGTNTYSIRIDKLTSNGNTCYICDYKTNSKMMTQEEADADRQLAMYALWVKQRYPGFKTVLLWNMLKFNKIVTSKRTYEELKKTRQETINLINKINECTEFTANVSKLCDYCVYKGICPKFNQK